MLKVNKDDILLVKTYEGMQRLAIVVNYFISPIDSETVYLLKYYDCDTQGLYEESRIICKVQLKNNK